MSISSTHPNIPTHTIIIIGVCVCVRVWLRYAVRSAYRKFAFNGQQYTKHAARRTHAILHARPWNIAEITLLLCCCRGAQASLSAATRAPSPMHTNIAHSHAQHTHTHTQKMCARQCVSGIVCSVSKVACSPAAVRLLSVDAAKQPNITAVMCTNRFFLCAQRCSS